MKRLFVLIVMGFATSTVAAQSGDLTGGVLILHAPPGVSFSGYSCEDGALASCGNQVNQMPIDGAAVQVFFVVSNFWNDSHFLGVEFGLDYDDAVFGRAYYERCIPAGNSALEIQSGTFPQPGSGIALALTDPLLPWTGSMVTTTMILGYTYADGVIRLMPNPRTGGAGWSFSSAPCGISRLAMAPSASRSLRIRGHSPAG